MKYANGQCSACSAGTNEDSKNCWLKCANLYIVDIEGWSPDVILELGSMERTATRPLIILEPTYPDPVHSEQQEKHNTCKKFASHDLKRLGTVCSIPHGFAKKEARHPSNGRDPYQQDIDDLELDLRKIINGLELRKLNQNYAHYLSPLWICKECGVIRDIAEAVSEKFITLEYFKNTVEHEDIKDVADDLGSSEGLNIPPATIQSIFTSVTSILQKAGGHP